MEKDTKNQEIIDAYDYMGNASSAMDCTGLIPANPPDDYARESYEEIYHFLAKPADAVAKGKSKASSDLKVE